jgi:hypothetical protein
MREIRLSGSTSGEWKRSKVGYSGTGNRKGRVTRKAKPKPPRHSSTLPADPQTALPIVLAYWSPGQNSAD